MSVPPLHEPVSRHLRKDCVRVRSEGSVADALADAREASPAARFIYFYAIDDDGRLVGVVPTRSLLLSPPDAKIASIMIGPAVSLPESATLEDACDFFLLHRFLALPVVDADGGLVGVVDVEVYTEEMSELGRLDAEREGSEDFFQLIGVRQAELSKANTLGVFGRRFPWLLCNLAGGLAAAVVAGFFQGVLDRVVAVSLFIPVVLAVAESVAIQSLTLTLQAHHSLSRVRAKTVVRSLLRELPVGALLGVACAAVAAGAAWTWKGDGGLALCLLATMASTVALATSVGVLTPLTLQSLRTDPRIAAGPIVLTITDLMSLALYLSLAATLLT